MKRVLSILMVMVLILSMMTQAYAGKPVKDEDPMITYTGDSLIDVKENSSVNLSFNINFSGNGRWVYYIDQIEETSIETNIENPTLDFSVDVASVDRAVKVEFYDANKNKEKLVASYETVIQVKEAPNNNPVISLASNLSMEEDSSGLEIATASDVDGDLLSLSSTSPQVIYTTDTFIYVPVENFYGSDTFDITVDDGRAGIITQTVTVEINAVNDAPVIAKIDDFNIEVNQLYEVTVLASDIDSHNLIYSILETDSPASINQEGLLTFKASEKGSYEFTVVVNDDGQPVESSQQVVTASVHEVNIPPVLTLSTEVLIMDEDSQGLSVIADASDANSDVLTITSNHSNVSQDGRIFTYVPSPDFYGSDSFEIFVDDGYDTVSKTVNVTINPINDAPVMEVIENFTVDESILYELDVIASDLESSVLDYAIVEDVSLAAIDESGHLTFLATSPGTYTFTVSVTDQDELKPLTVQQVVQVTVTEVIVNDELVYLALGDSIPEGTYYRNIWDYIFGGTDSNSYIEQFADFLQADIYEDRSVSGYNAIDVYNILNGIYDSDYNDAHSKQDVKSLVESADVITLCVGANDIMDAAPRKTSGLDKYSINFEVADQGLENFTNDWPRIIDSIYALNNDVTLIVMTIYNPFRETDEIYSQIDSYFINNGVGMNDIIINHDTSAYVATFEYKVADVYAEFNDNHFVDPLTGRIMLKDELTGFYNSFCDPHPNQYGQNLIFDVHQEVFLTQ